MQHDYNINSADSISGLQFRTDVNNALGAINSANSGIVAPTTYVPGTLWLDTSITPNLLKVRNTANTAWVIIPIEDALATPLASQATITIGNYGSGGTIHVTGTTTVSSLGASTTGTVRTVIFDSAITITHNATSLILPNAVSMTLSAGSIATFVCENGVSGYWRCISVMRNDVSSLELSYLSNVTSDIQTQLGNKQPIDGDLTAIGNIGATAGYLKKLAADSWTLVNPTTISAYGITDAYTKTEIDSQLAGLKAKTSVVCATTAGLVVNTAYPTIDGVTLTSSSRVLVKDQGTPSQNGIYTGVTTVSWVRAVDVDTADDLIAAYTFVEQGTTNADTAWVQTADNITLGTTALTWVKFAGSGAYAPVTGSTSITTLGTIGTGVWNATDIAVSSGGTGTSTAPVAGGIIYGASTSAYGTTSAGSQDYILKSNVAGAPTWTVNDLTSFPSSAFKKSCRVATTAALTLNAATASIDGITLATADRVLIKDQAAPAQNGIYTGVTTTTWVRVPDADTASEIANALIAIDEGTVNGGQYFSNTFKPTDTLGTTSMAWYKTLTTQGVDAGTINSGTLPVARGGTGSTTSTGTAGTAVVLATSPTLVTPSIGVATGTSFNSITGLASVAPLAPAVTAVVGTSTLTARQDHVHPTNFTVTATDIKMNGTQAVGTLTTFPRADHVHPSDTSRLPLAGGTMTGAITALRETKVAMGADDINLASGNLFTKTISVATTLTVSNWLATGNANSFILELTNGGSAVVTWFSGVKWASGIAPTLTAAGVDILGFYSHDGGVTVRGLVLSKDSK